jgi:hypothetical protein
MTQAISNTTYTSTGVSTDLSEVENILKIDPQEHLLKKGDPKSSSLENHNIKKVSKSELEKAAKELSTAKKILGFNLFAAVIMLVISVAAIIFLWKVSVLFTLAAATASLGSSIHITVQSVRAYRATKETS